MPDQPERYIDPNSGAAPQPGGMAVVHELPDEPEKEHPAGNVTEPDEARKLTKKQAEDPTGGVKELPDELVKGGTHDTEVQNQAMPLDDASGPVAPYAGAGVSTDDDGNPVGADGEGVTGEPETEVKGDPGVTIDSTNTRIGGELPTTEGHGADENGAALPTVEQPNKSASKADWTAYAKSKGATEADLEGKSRDEIRDAYAS